MGIVFPAPNASDVTFIAKLRYIDRLTDVGSGGMLGIGILLMIFFPLFLMMKAFKMESALAVAALITAVCGILVRILLPTNDLVLYISIILFIGALYFLKRSSSQLEI